MTYYLQDHHGEGYADIKTLQDVEALVSYLCGIETPIPHCTLELDGIPSAVILPLVLPEFTPHEELALLDIYNVAMDREIKDCNAAIKKCNRKIAELSGFQLLKGGTDSRRK